MILLQLFGTFFRIGLFTIGGGYAMVPIIEEALVDKKGWISRDDFVDTLALSQSASGILAVNISIVTGYRIAALPGAISAALGTVMPSFLIILIIAMFFTRFSENAVVERIFKGIRPAVVALIAAPVFRLGKSAKVNLRNLWIPVVAALLIWLLDFSPIWIVLIAGGGGYLYGLIQRKRGVR
ncbi:MAG: chromate transporter [Coprobacter sp.]|nr:chromate transporter [Coprobacter sp.]